MRDGDVIHGNILGGGIESDLKEAGDNLGASAEKSASTMADSVNSVGKGHAACTANAFSPTHLKLSAMMIEADFSMPAPKLSPASFRPDSMPPPRILP